MRKRHAAICVVALVLASFSAFGFVAVDAAQLNPSTPQPGGLAGLGFALLAVGQWMRFIGSSS
jgi:hypothetical protein